MSQFERIGGDARQRLLSLDRDELIIVKRDIGRLTAELLRTKKGTQTAVDLWNRIKGFQDIKRRLEEEIRQITQV